jgi:cytoskeletal protein CcmA (bactofilin family)
MGFFSSSNKETQEESSNTSAQKEVKAEPSVAVNRDMIKTPTGNVSVIKESFKVKATMEGKGSLIIGCDFEGDIKVEDTLFIEKGAKFSGTVNAKNVKVSGDFSGSILSTVTEVTQSGNFEGNIKTNKAFLGGTIGGTIVSIDSIEISSSGKVVTKECKSKQIKVEGKVEGRVVASELLEVTNSGVINGDIITKGIRTEQGGSIVGNIQTYDANIHDKDNNQQFNAQEVTPKADEIDPEIANLIKIKPDDMKKYARKEDKSIKRIPTDKM